ncbi:MAG: hypothetical protein ACRENE_16295 [Polyangiaceae bacterium]
MEGSRLVARKPHEALSKKGSGSTGTIKVSGSSRAGNAPGGPPVLSCGEADKVRTHDLSSETATEAFAPCSAAGARDYSALVKIQTIDDGVHIVIDATDDEVTLLGTSRSATR